MIQAKKTKSMDEARNDMVKVISTSVRGLEATKIHQWLPTLADRLNGGKRAFAPLVEHLHCNTEEDFEEEMQRRSSFLKKSKKTSFNNEVSPN